MEYISKQYKFSIKINIVDLLVCEAEFASITFLDH
jgi:hypothetical protein